VAHIARGVYREWVKPYAIYRAGRLLRVGVGIGFAVGMVYASNHYIAPFLDHAFGGLNSRSSPIVQAGETMLGEALTYAPGMGLNLLRGFSNKKNYIASTVTMAATAGAYSYWPQVSNYMTEMFTKTPHHVFTNPDAGSALIITGFGIAVASKFIEMLFTPLVPQ
jgi:hypothetical protein